MYMYRVSPGDPIPAILFVNCHFFSYSGTVWQNSHGCLAADQTRLEARAGVQDSRKLSSVNFLGFRNCGRFRQVARHSYELGWFCGSVSGARTTMVSRVATHLCTPYLRRTYAVPAPYLCTHAPYLRAMFDI